jgi:ATP phosphoribosyltransferase
VNLTRRHFARYGIAEYRIVESAGATEAAPAAGTADLIVDITETGATLSANNMRVLEDGLIMKSEANLIVSRTANWTPLRKAQLEALLSIMGGVPPGISTLL